MAEPTHSSQIVHQHLNPERDRHTHTETQKVTEAPHGTNTFVHLPSGDCCLFRAGQALPMEEHRFGVVPGPVRTHNGSMI
jgi:hypothetical protein